MSLGQASIGIGLVAGVSFVATKVIRTRKFEGADIAAMSGVFFAGCNIPVAFFLMWYGLDPDPDNVPTKLHSYEKFVSVAGLTLFVTAMFGIWAAFAAVTPAPAPVPDEPSDPKEQD